LPPAPPEEIWRSWLLVQLAAAIATLGALLSAHCALRRYRVRCRHLAILFDPVFGTCPQATTVHGDCHGEPGLCTWSLVSKFIIAEGIRDLLPPGDLEGARHRAASISQRLRLQQGASAREPTEPAEPTKPAEAFHTRRRPAQQEGVPSASAAASTMPELSPCPPLLPQLDIRIADLDNDDFGAPEGREQYRFQTASPRGPGPVQEATGRTRLPPLRVTAQRRGASNGTYTQLDGDTQNQQDGSKARRARSRRRAQSPEDGDRARTPPVREAPSRSHKPSPPTECEGLLTASGGASGGEERTEAGRTIDPKMKVRQTVPEVEERKTVPHSRNARLYHTVVALEKDDASALEKDDASALLCGVKDASALEKAPHRPPSKPPVIPKGRRASRASCDDIPNTEQGAYVEEVLRLAAASEWKAGHSPQGRSDRGWGQGGDQDHAETPRRSLALLRRMLEVEPTERAYQVEEKVGWSVQKPLSSHGSGGEEVQAARAKTSGGRRAEAILRQQIAPKGRSPPLEPEQGIDVKPDKELGEQGAQPTPKQRSPFGSRRGSIFKTNPIGDEDGIAEVAAPIEAMWESSRKGKRSQSLAQQGGYCPPWLEDASGGTWEDVHGSARAFHRTTTRNVELGRRRAWQVARRLSPEARADTHYAMCGAGYDWCGAELRRGLEGRTDLHWGSAAWGRASALGRQSVTLRVAQGLMRAVAAQKLRRLAIRCRAHARMVWLWRRVQEKQRTGVLLSAVGLPRSVLSDCMPFLAARKPSVRKRRKAGVEGSLRRAMTQDVDDKSRKSARKSWVQRLSFGRILGTTLVFAFLDHHRLVAPSFLQQHLQLAKEKTWDMARPWSFELMLAVMVELVKWPSWARQHKDLWNLLYLQEAGGGLQPSFQLANAVHGSMPFNVQSFPNLYRYFNTCILPGDAGLTTRQLRSAFKLDEKCESAHVGWQRAWASACAMSKASLVRCTCLCSPFVDLGELHRQRRQLLQRAHSAIDDNQSVVNSTEGLKDVAMQVVQQFYHMNQSSRKMIPEHTKAASPDLPRETTGWRAALLAAWERHPWGAILRADWAARPYSASQRVMGLCVSWLLMLGAAALAAYYRGAQHCAAVRKFLGCDLELHLPWKDAITGWTPPFQECLGAGSCLELYSRHLCASHGTCPEPFRFFGTSSWTEQLQGRLGEAALTALLLALLPLLARDTWLGGALRQSAARQEQRSWGGLGSVREEWKRPCWHAMYVCVTGIVDGCAELAVTVHDRWYFWWSTEQQGRSPWGVFQELQAAQALRDLRRQGLPLFPAGRGPWRPAEAMFWGDWAFLLWNMCVLVVAFWLVINFGVWVNYLSGRAGEKWTIITWVMAIAMDGVVSPVCSMGLVVGRHLLTCRRAEQPKADWRLSACRCSTAVMNMAGWIGGVIRRGSRHGAAKYFMEPSEKHASAAKSGTDTGTVVQTFVPDQDKGEADRESERKKKRGTRRQKIDKEAREEAAGGGQVSVIGGVVTPLRTSSIARSKIPWRESGTSHKPLELERKRNPKENLVDAPDR
ncbi:hypothetical protein CYMTET_51352, partial [Cymbomonas tetramitiformis]